MKRLSHALLALAPALLGAPLLAHAAPAAEAGLVWRGDFESGDLSQWTKSEKVADDRLEVVPSDPALGGRYVLKTTVRQGDDPIDASGNRNELVYVGDPAGGQERFYRWRTMWPEDYPAADDWQLFTQWHHDGTSGSPPVEFYVFGDEIRLRVNGEILWRTPLVRGQWHQFDLHVKWAESEGFVELAFDGQPALPMTPAATLYAGQGVYLKQGLYRDESIQPEQVVFHDGMTIATTRAALDAADAATGASRESPTSPQWALDGSGAVVGMSDAGCDSTGEAGLSSALVGLAGGGLLLRRRRPAAIAASVRRR
jgi:uncharacterized protein (TIGR03382 family)